MSFALYNETFYLANNLDVQQAVNAGIFASGLSHFQLFGLGEGRVKISPFYDEATYLRNNPDVGTAVNNGALRSGLQHFIQLGEAEGRVNISPLWNESTYLSLNPDVAGAVNRGLFASGLQHFLALGNGEGRPGGPNISLTPAGFNESAYLAIHSDVRIAVESGVLSSGLAHYQSFGQFEAARAGVFLGTRGSDTINAFGQATGIIGVGLSNISPLGIGGVDGIPTSLGVGEIDTLIGGSGGDVFNLGIGITPLQPTQQKLYVGQGNRDYALIKSFQLEKDLIVLAGEPREYRFDTANGNFLISTAGGDLVGIVEGVTNLQIRNIFDDGTFAVSGGDGSLITQIPGFNDSVYLAVNRDVAAAVAAGVFPSGLAHYQQFGQNEGRVGVFTGSSGSDVITGFGQNTSLVGVGLTVVADSPNQDVVIASQGTGQSDALIGSFGADTFVLGTGISFANSTIQPFYIGNGNEDYAVIRNFEPGKDQIQLGGNPAEYTFQASDGNLNIFRNPGDLVGIVEGVTNIVVTQAFTTGRFLMS
ncbi:hypothetical protein [Laspinema olomoucense]|uniref:hypothetical protein n=1 Tax=Laspinema olomoucense TaxID=3231600 RepID=UPI0021BAD74B|nr:hypothetical protein [Laspinema sp. D3c]MCT7994043.1 hypothetical protein [Laspinema sp. D3c]